ncbi:hypothetical protein ADIAL_2005 [Alkalibacterium sp. AK22]|uniref:hypothetical protein n=1 Tax=Alkalibacterium sp. AK22 TaxID=1229520 RepID=UPI000449FB6E|nr:hypothetical protein [Alkalibacterium sp. AK22]EXJ22419.1 hypothetical protein ADIAL_2005 [Alkalibacterium sp. AK22]
MTVKWTRESVLVLVTVLLVLLAVFYYGNHLLLTPFRAAADTSASILNDQNNLLERFPPSEVVLNDLIAKKEESHAYIPDGENMRQALLALHEQAQQNNINLNQIARVRDSEVLEGQSGRYRSTGYLLEWSSASAADFTAFLEDLDADDRLWSSEELSYQQDVDGDTIGFLLIDFFHSGDTEPAESTVEVESAS